MTNENKCYICGEKKYDKNYKTHIHMDRILLWPFFMIYDNFFNPHRKIKMVI